MKPITLLVDNGSLVAAATLRLREIARGVSQLLGEHVLPVSLLHSSGVPAQDLEGVPAEILEPALAKLLERGAHSFLVLPLFFGPSRALTDYLPQRIAQLQKKWPRLRVTVAPTLYQENDPRLAQILADNVRCVSHGIRPRVALVDHGSPVREVTFVRNALARQLALQLDGADVCASSMERRAGPAYDFNEPLLEQLLTSDGWNTGDVVVAMQFLLPGRHAGPDGDVAAICARARHRSPGLRTRVTPLVGDHALLSAILADRWKSAMAQSP